VSRTALPLGFALAVVLGAICLGGGGRRPAEEIVREFNTVKYPGFTEDISREEFQKLAAPAAERQCRLALELYESHPDHQDVSRLMAARWTLTVNSLQRPRRTIEETEKILAGGPKRLRAVAATRRAYAGLADPQTPVEERFRYVREALAEAPKDAHWGTKLLYALAFENSSRPAKQRELYELAVDRFGEPATRTMGSSMRLLDRIGRRVELAFEDVRTGKPMTLRKGRPTVVFVWSPTAECRDDIEVLRRARGVDVRCVYFGGSSRESAKERAAEHGVEWPLFVDEREFSEQWAWKFGVRFGRTFLLLDGDQRLRAVTHRAAPLFSCGRPTSGSGSAAGPGTGAD